MKKSKIEKLVNDTLKSRKCANNLLPLIDLVSNKFDQSVICDATVGITSIFKQFSASGDIAFDAQMLNSEPASTEHQYKDWIHERFSEFFSALIKCLLSCSSEVSSVLVESIICLLKLKSYFLTKNSNELLFAEKELDTLIRAILLCQDGSALQSFVINLKFDDFRYFVLKLIPTALNESVRKSSVVIERTFALLDSASHQMPDDKQIQHCLFVFQGNENDFTSVIAGAKVHPFNTNQQRKKFSTAWLEVLKLSLPGYLHKKILIAIHKNLIPHFAKPRLLADFLIKSYSCGGGLALLALHGLFVLMHEHNLEYPDFYKNLYAMLHPRIFDTKYRARFFHLLEIFLSSTHIPSYLIAAFCKKMARLCLVAPPHCIQIMVCLILNMLRKHPNVHHLIHQDPVKMSADLVTTDPFIETEADPAQCNALQSSLWEFSALSRHFCPEVAKCVSIKKVGDEEYDVSELLERDYNDAFSMDTISSSKYPTSSATNHVIPKAFFGGYEDITAELWGII